MGERFTVGERVKHRRDGRKGTIEELHYPNWVDWRIDGQASSLGRIDPSNLERLATQ